MWDWPIDCMVCTMFGCTAWACNDCPTSVLGDKLIWKQIHPNYFNFNINMTFTFTTGSFFKPLSFSGLLAFITQHNVCQSAHLFQPECQAIYLAITCAQPIFRWTPGGKVGGIFRLNCTVWVIQWTGCIIME